MIKNNVIKFIFIDILLIFFISMQYIVFYIFDDYYLKYLELQLMLVFIYQIYSIYKISHNWLNLYLLFLMMIF